MGFVRYHLIINSVSDSCSGAALDGETGEIEERNLQEDSDDDSEDDDDDDGGGYYFSFITVF